VTLFYAGEDERQCGALLECGAALAAGKRVFVVSPYQWTFANHERCRRFDSLEAAVRVLAPISLSLSLISLSYHSLWPKSHTSGLLNAEERKQD
jgi:hypothetical protein